MSHGNETYTQIADVREMLHKKWPKCFKGKGEVKLPLKVGIYRDVKSQCSISGNLLYLALRDYASGPTYLNSCVTGAERVDLNGEVCGVVDEKGEKFSKDKLAQLEAFWSKRKVG